MDHATHPDTEDRLYFRQLLAGRDFATEDQLARQMVNFVYLIGDRETGDAVVVDPAYDVDGILDALADDDMRPHRRLVTPLRNISITLMRTWRKLTCVLTEVALRYHVGARVARTGITSNRAWEPIMTAWEPYRSFRVCSCTAAPP